MKIRHITIVSVCCILASCTSFLEETPKSQYPAEGFYTSKSALEGGLFGIYQGYKNLPIYLLVMSNAGTDLIKPYKNTSVYGMLCCYTFTSEHQYFENMWANLYTVVMRANTILMECDRADYLSDADYKRIRSEALFLRAQAYYFLVTNWGDVPLITEPAENGFDYTLPREPLVKVYGQIVEDLTYASTRGHLPETRPEDAPSRATRYAALGLLGKTYLTMASFKESGVVGGYDAIAESEELLYGKARDAFEYIMDYSDYELVPVYGDNFFPAAKESNTEAIFEIWFGSGELGSSWPRDILGGYGTVKGSGNPSTDLRLNGAYCGKRNLVPAGSFINTYRKGDGRREWNIQDFSITLIDGVWKQTPITKVESMFAPKFRQGAWNEIIKHAYSQCENNYTLMRYADILLMYAETELKLNGGRANQKAVDAVNRIVRRARYPKTAAETPEFPDYTTATLTFEALMDERAKELCFEPIRRIDLARTGLLEEKVLGSSFTGAKQNFASHHYLFPIPAYEINITRNPEQFRQNPGYGKGVAVTGKAE